jgi:hypothetical protein
MTIPEYEEFLRTNNQLIINESPNILTEFSPLLVTTSLFGHAVEAKSTSEYPAYHFNDIGKPQTQAMDGLTTVKKTIDIYDVLEEKRNTL